MLSLPKNKNFQFFYSKRFLSQLVEKKDNNIIPLNLVGETKHYPPANKEWTNSVYAYNKNNLKSLAAKDNMTKRLIKSYFNLNMDKTIARSKRMRSLIRKSTVKKLFVSSPEIKQTNDKVIVTVYTFDRERQFLLRKLYFKTIKWERLKAVYMKQLKEKMFIAQSFDKYDAWRTTKKLTVYNKITNDLEIKGNNLVNQEDTQRLNLPYLFKSKSNVMKYMKKLPLNSNSYSKFITFVIRRNKKQFNPKKIAYKYKRLLKGTSKLKSFKRFLRKRYLMFIKKRKRIIRRKLPYFGFKHYNFMNFLHYTMHEKYAKAKRMLWYNYMIYLLSLADIKVHIFEDTMVINKKKQKKLNQEDYQLLEILKKKINKKKVNKNSTKNNLKVKKAVPNKKIKNILIKKEVSFYARRHQQYNKSYLFNGQTFIRFYKDLNGSDKSSNKLINRSITLENPSWRVFRSFIVRLVQKILTQKNMGFRIKEDFSNYSKRYFMDVFYKSMFYVKDKNKLRKNLRRFNEDVLTINDILKIIINRFKFGKFLSGLKILISKIYNKKTELNIVNLKSPHLNTDIFTEAVAIKLKKRVGLLRVMRRSLQLVKLPYKFKSAAQMFNVNKLEILNLYRSLKLSNLKGTIALNNIRNTSFTNADYLQGILKTLYSRSLINQPKLVNNARNKLFTQTLSNKNQFSMLNKVTSVLNTIKYKWATGVRLEAAGRLTRRYTASRSVFKFRHKGSLKNTDYSRKLDFLKNTMPNVMLRNIAKSNSQHSFFESKKRIGAYGLKTWISSY